MKKLIVAIIVLVLLTSCFGASWEQTKKNLKADYSGGLVRTIRVYDARTGETLFEYHGKCYISDGSSQGNYTIVYYDSHGDSKKADFIGEYISIVSIED